MTDRQTPGNRVLADIPASEYRRLEAQLEPVTLKFGEVLYEPGQAIRHVYFPIDCLISLLTAVDKRRTLEVGMVGNEGMAGMPFILGVGLSGVRALVQGGGKALRMPSGRFRIEFDRNRPLQQALFRYTYALMAQISRPTCSTETVITLDELQGAHISCPCPTCDTTLSIARAAGNIRVSVMPAPRPRLTVEFRTSDEGSVRFLPERKGRLRRWLCLRHRKASLRRGIRRLRADGKACTG
jgi:hypothetical protein